jgi:chorismate mutase/prephenate dehydrogenase
MTLQELRTRLSAVDRELISLVAERQRIVSEIGIHKIHNAVPTRDYEREKEVVKGAAEQAGQLGLEPELAEQIMHLLIRSSLTHQERTRVAAHSEGAGKRALIIGGTGKMGGWFADFLSSQGFEVDLADPRADPSVPYQSVRDWRDIDLKHDLIVVATPIKVAAQVLQDLAAVKPAGLVVDVGSLKTPLREGLQALVDAKCNVTSIHPMFGPDARLLSGKHVIFVDVGVNAATEQAKELFAPTMVERIDMNLDQHDRLIAYVLGLSHALNLVFFTALAESGELVPRLKTMSSTTFDAQLRVASLVAMDNPHLYFEIQSLNEFGRAPLESLLEAIRRLLRLIDTNDEAGFVDLMLAGRQYLDKSA